MERLTKRVHGIGGFALVSDHIDGKLTVNYRGWISAHADKLGE